MSVRLEVQAKPGSRAPGIARKAGSVVVAVRERAVDGAANDAIRDAVARWLGIAPSAVRLLHGAAGRRKVLEAEVDDALLAERLAGLPER